MNKVIKYGAIACGVVCSITTGSYLYNQLMCDNFLKYANAIDKCFGSIGKNVGLSNASRVLNEDLMDAHRARERNKSS